LVDTKDSGFDNFPTTRTEQSPFLDERLNDFHYNMAAGAGPRACCWLVP
jgi:hypothetical protein